MNSCIVCLEESDKLININHCGLYYIHKSCYKKWLIKNKNTCIICKEELQIRKEINIIYIILIKFCIIITTLLLAGMSIYIFVICDLKNQFCKLF